MPAKWEKLFLLPALIAITAGVARQAFAQGHVPPLRMADLIAEVESNNPAIQAAELAHRASQQRPIQERTLPDPMLGFMWTNMSNPVPFTTISEDPMSNAGISFRQEIPYPTKLKLRGRIAEVETKSEAAALTETRLSILAKAKILFFDLAYSYEAEDILKQSEETLRKLTEIAQARYEAGDGTQQDVMKALVELHLIEGELRSLAAARSSAVAQLYALLNRDDETDHGRPEQLKPSPLAYSEDDLLKTAEQNNPLLRIKKHAVSERRLQKRLAQKEYSPDFELGGFYGNSGSLPDMWQFQVELKLPLYFWRKQAPAVSEAGIRLRQARENWSASRQELLAQIRDNCAQARAAQDLLRLYAEQVSTDARAALESSLYSYQTGKVDFLTVLSNVLTIRQYRLREREELAKLNTALARLEAMTGLPLLLIDQKDK